MRKQGQVFVFDYMTSLFLFIIVLVAGIVLVVDLLPDDSFEILHREHIYVGQKLMEPGFPDDWNATNVIVPGISNSNRINQTLYNKLKNMSYNEVKSAYQISGDFFFVLRNSTQVVPIYGDCGYGYALGFNVTTCEPFLDNITYDNLITSSRLTIYESRVVELELFTWQ